VQWSASVWISCPTMSHPPATAKEVIARMSATNETPRGPRRPASPDADDRESKGRELRAPKRFECYKRNDRD